jgi:hypothetical protein
MSAASPDGAGKSTPHSGSSNPTAGRDRTGADTAASRAAGKEGERPANANAC